MNKDRFLRVLAGGPKVRRTHCYIQAPAIYEIYCPANQEHKTTWSEYEKRIWCYDCERDYIPEHVGIFDGPIPMQVSALLGISFDRLNVVTGERLPSDSLNDVFNATWVKSPELERYEGRIRKIMPKRWCKEEVQKSHRRNNGPNRS